MKIVTCENLSLGYEGKNIVHNISFSINKGDYLCIVGENGSGKTTLMRGLLNLIKPYSGKITINDSKIGYLPQQTSVQKDFPVTVIEVILSGCHWQNSWSPFYTKKDKLKVYEIAKKLEITEILKKSYQELSGGQQQRVLIARALCAAGNLLILDEPASGLDPIITNEIYELIDKLNKEDSMTVIMVSHDIKASVKYASHILHIGNNGAYFMNVDDYKSSAGAKDFLGGEHNE